MFKFSEDKKKIFDICINLLATSVCTVVLNFIVYPYYAKTFNSSDYGNIITIIGVVNLLWAVFGNGLNNTRLILNKQYSAENKAGNYNIIILSASLVGGLIGILVVQFYSIVTVFSTIIVCATIICGITRAYFVVYYRLKLDYVSQLKTNVIVSFGYMGGLLFSKNAESWPIALFAGEFLALLYTLKKGTLINEPFKLTEDKTIVLRTYGDVIGTSMLGNLLAYFDRFLINPVLGAAFVATYSVASFWGKVATPFIAPTASVMLSYLCQKENRITVKRYIMIFVFSILPLLLFGLLGVWVAPIITQLLYPTLVKDALPYIGLSSFGNLIQSATSLILPILMSVCSTQKILFIQMIYFFCYVALALIGTILLGLKGFCISLCISGLLKAVVFFVVGYHELRRDEEMAEESKS